VGKEGVCVRRLVSVCSQSLFSGGGYGGTYVWLDVSYIPARHLYPVLRDPDFTSYLSIVLFLCIYCHTTRWMRSQHLTNQFHRLHRTLS